MTKSIDRVIYDTEKAEKIAEYTENNEGDFEYLKETLYHTRKGNWFLHGEGGPKSIYTEWISGSTYGSEEIISMDEDDAIEWCERRQQIAALEKHFPEAIEEA
jgi:hypothetical protein